MECIAFAHRVTLDGPCVRDPSSAQDFRLRPGSKANSIHATAIDGSAKAGLWLGFQT